MPLLMQTAGALLVALVAVQLGAIIVSSLQQAAGARRQRELSTELLRERLTAANTLRAQRQQNQFSWKGYRKFEVHRKVCEADNVCSFYLVPHDKKPLPLFDPGQYLTFRLQIPGQDKPVVRCYSISSPPDYGAVERTAHYQKTGELPSPEENYYRVTIKRVFPPRDKQDAPPGLVSNYFHDHVEEGDILDVQAPRGQFTLDVTESTPIALVGGGVGITPMLSMVGAVARQQPTRKVWLFYGVRNSREHALRSELDRLAGGHENLSVVYCYSHPTDEDREGTDYHVSGWISVDLFKRMLQVPNYEFYVCGPPPMMDAVVHGLQEWGVPENAILMEAFGPATVKAAHKPAPAEAPAQEADTAPPKAKIVFSRSGTELDWDPDCGNLLELAERHGVEIDSGCRAGNCGTCLVAIKSGSTTYCVEHGGEDEDGACLTCVSVPAGDLVLDA